MSADDDFALGGGANVNWNVAKSDSAPGQFVFWKLAK
jgi:hypothetical protein